MKTLILIILISIISCNGTEKSPKVKTNEKTQTEFTLPKSEYVILPFNKKKNWIFKNAKQTELTQTELIKIEEILKIAVKKNNENQEKEVKTHNEKYPKDKWNKTGYELSLDGKKRQYIPVINENGEKEVWINFFCNDWGSENWKSEIMIVMDGGNCYFNLKINLTKGSYSELYINGYA
jgi:hypothetical protein